MASRIEILWRQALKTFSGCNNPNYKLCMKNFEKLRSLIDEITAEDVHVDKTVLDYVRNQSAQMCCIDVFENQDITIAIFILKTGVTLPMHNHPQMHGLLKVISGCVKIDSYSIESDINGDKKEDDRIHAIKHPSITVKSTDPACELTPLEKNIHEISCIEGPAAFLDILSPPYDVGEFSKVKRPCTFFKVATTSEKSDNVQLMVTEVPPTFYSKNIKYLGEPLRFSNLFIEKLKKFFNL